MSDIIYYYENIPDEVHVPFTLYTLSIYYYRSPILNSSQIRIGMSGESISGVQVGYE